MGGKRMSHFRVRIFLDSAAVVLLSTGLAKVASVLTGGEVLRTHDPVTGLGLGTLFGRVGSLEVAVALLCLFSRRVGLSVVLLLWLGASFVVYRLGLWWVGGPRYCGCPGTMTGALRLSPAAADLALKLALAYLLVGGRVALRVLLKQAEIKGLLRA